MISIKIIIYFALVVPILISMSACDTVDESKVAKESIEYFAESTSSSTSNESDKEIVKSSTSESQIESSSTASETNSAPKTTDEISSMESIESEAPYIYNPNIEQQIISPPITDEYTEKRWTELNRIKTGLENVLSPDVYGGIVLDEFEEYKNANNNLEIYAVDVETIKKEVEKLEPDPIVGHIYYNEDSISLTEISRILNALEENKDLYGIIDVEVMFNAIFIDAPEKTKEAKKFVETLNIKEGHVIFRQDMASMVTGDAPN